MVADGGAEFFATPPEWRAWLEAYGDSVSEVWVGLHKQATGALGLTWDEATDEALCFGWIDGLRQSVDKDRYRIRFTPRRAGSRWSAKNLKRFEELNAEGRVRPRGLAAYQRRSDQPSEPTDEELSPELRERLEANGAAWVFFESQPPGYRRTALRWVMDAKREATRERRLAELIEDSANGLRINALRR